MPAYRPLVSVIIPAYNEERVIEASVHRILPATITRSK
jgi:glycosyltransferase involved in cell wall biosynthesis